MKKLLKGISTIGMLTSPTLCVVSCKYNKNGIKTFTFDLNEIKNAKDLIVGPSKIEMINGETVFNVNELKKISTYPIIKKWLDSKEKIVNQYKYGKDMWGDSSVRGTDYKLKTLDGQTLKFNNFDSLSFKVLSIFNVYSSQLPSTFNS